MQGADRRGGQRVRPHRPAAGRPGPPNGAPTRLLGSSSGRDGASRKDRGSPRCERASGVSTIAKTSQSPSAIKDTTPKRTEHEGNTAPANRPRRHRPWTQDRRARGNRIIHLLDTSGEFGEKPYLGLEYVALILGGIAIAGSPLRTRPRPATSCAVFARRGLRLRSRLGGMNAIHEDVRSPAGSRRPCTPSWEDLVSWLGLAAVEAA